MTFPLAARATEVAPRAKPVFLWKVTAGQGTVYLLGSIHAAKPEIYPLDERIEKAFKSADVLVVEVDASADKMLSLAGAMMQKAMYPPGDSLDKHISTDLFEQTKQHLARSGIPIDQWKQFKPWFLAITIAMLELQQLGIKPENGIDLHFLNRARGNKQIQELETADAQLNLLDSFSDVDQERFLKYTIQETDNIARNVNDMIRAWSNGEVDWLTAFLQKPTKDFPELRPLLVKLFDERNKQMAEKIRDYLNTGKTYFVVVGAGHVVGDNGLVKLLSKHGDVKQM